MNTELFEQSSIPGLSYPIKPKDFVKPDVDGLSEAMYPI